MITLKKSFELKNYLEGLYVKALGLLGVADNVTVTTNNHMRKKAFKDAEDEVIVDSKSYSFPEQYTVMDIVDFALYTLYEMERLTDAINKAKNSDGVSFDGLITKNNNKRKLLKTLEFMYDIKNSESTYSDTATKFNEEGNQVSYTYDVKRVITIDFDRNAVKSIANRLRKELDETSNSIDLMQIERLVDFDTKFEIGDSFEDAMEKFKSI